MIIEVDISTPNQISYRKSFADCFVRTHDNKILLQRRPANWSLTNTETITAFGGHMENGETPAETAIRELNEETGAQIYPEDIYYIASITESWTNHQDIVHLFFWHDKLNTITGCYEAEAITFQTINEALESKNLMEYVAWGLERIKKIENELKEIQ